jgi:hypothetical protein
MSTDTDIANIDWIFLYGDGRSYHIPAYLFWIVDLTGPKDDSSEGNNLPPIFK